MASKYVIEVKGWPGHAHEVTVHTEQEAQDKAQELVKASNVEGVTMHAHGGRHDGKDYHWQGKNEDGHPREIKIVVGEAHTS
jgi:hypothetical protein